MTVFSFQDFHVHSGFLEHTNDCALGFTKEALKQGYSRIAITEHFTYPFAFNEDNFNRDYDTIKSEKRFVIRNRKSICLSDYFEELKNLKQKNPKYQILAGLECDYFVGMEEKIKNEIENESLDYCLGAIHYIQNPRTGSLMHVASKEFKDFQAQTTEGSIYENYFSILIKAVKSGLFDCIAHIDFVKKKFDNYSEEKALPFIEEALETMVKHNVGLEINTNGPLAQGTNFASPTIIQKFVKIGGQKLVVGSDSHSIQEFKNSCKDVKMLCKKYQDFLWWGKNGLEEK